MDKTTIKFCGLIGIIAIIISCCSAVPKYEGNNKSSSSNTNTNNQWNRSYKDNDTDAAPTSDRVERLGYTSGYGSINSYPHSSVGYGYSPMKIDLGGVVLGAIIGVGALLIIPKIVGTLNGGYGYGGNYRSVDGADQQFGLSEMMSKLDDILGKNNIDSTNCVQRAVCTYVRQSTYHHKMGTYDQTDSIVTAFSDNALVDYMINGTAIKEALENGRNLDADNCDKIYKSCPLDKQQSLQILTKLLPDSAAVLNSA